MIKSILGFNKKQPIEKTVSEQIKDVQDTVESSVAIFKSVATTLENSNNELQILIELEENEIIEKKKNIEVAQKAMDENEVLFDKLQNFLF